MLNLRCALTAVAALLAASALGGCVVLTKGEHQGLLDQLAEVKAARDEAVVELAVKNDELAKTKALLEQATINLTAARTELDEQRTKLRAELETERAKAARLTNQNTALQLAVQDAAKAIVAAAKKARELEAQLEIKNQQVAILQEAKKKLQDQIAKLKRAPAPAPE